MLELATLLFYAGFVPAFTLGALQQAKVNFGQVRSLVLCRLNFH